MIKVGRVCIKTAGREAGKFCCVIKKVDDKFVEVTGPKDVTGVRRRKCNIEHIEPTEFVIKIKSDATDADVSNAYKKDGILANLGIENKDKKSSTKSKPAAKKKTKSKPKKK